MIAGATALLTLATVALLAWIPGLVDPGCLGGAAAALTQETEIAVYRVAKEALDAYERRRRATVTSSNGELVVIVEGGAGEGVRSDRLATIAARVELLGGTLHVDGVLRASIPLGTTAVAACVRLPPPA